MTYNLLSAVGHGSALEQPISSHADDNENDTENLASLCRKNK